MKEEHQEQQPPVQGMDHTRGALAGAPRYSTVKAIAPLLDLTPGALFSLIRKGAIPKAVAPHVGRSIRIDTLALAAFLEKGGTQSTV